MAEVKVLVEGYTTENPGGKERSCCTVSLVRDGDIVMVVDPGTLKSQDVLVKALKKEGLKVSDVTHVSVTHTHMDHYRNVGMFADAKTLDNWGIWDHDSVEDYNPQFTKDIKIIETPGHDSSNITLLVNTSKGTIAICGDVFWKKDFPKSDPYASDKKKLAKSRKLVLEKADFVVPGHAGMYEV